MLTNEEMKKFYPQLSSRVLLFLRQQRYRRREVLTEDIIKKFNKSKSEISQVLSFLTNQHYINREYVKNLNNQGSRHRVVLNEKGLEYISKNFRSKTFIKSYTMIIIISL